jgi:hypothetical protein
MSTPDMLSVNPADRGLGFWHPSEFPCARSRQTTVQTPTLISKKHDFTGHLGFFWTHLGGEQSGHQAFSFEK